MMKHIRLLAILILLPLAAWAGDTLLIPATGGAAGRFPFVFHNPNATGAADSNMRLAVSDAIDPTQEGYVMPWSGSIVGASCSFEAIATFTTGGVASVAVKVNNVVVTNFAPLSATVSGVGIILFNGVQAAGLDTFAVGDFLGASSDITASGIATNGTLDSNTEDWICTVFVEFD